MPHSGLERKEVTRLLHLSPGDTLHSSIEYSSKKIFSKSLCVQKFGGLPFLRTLLLQSHLELWVERICYPAQDFIIKHLGRSSTAGSHIPKMKSAIPGIVGLGGEGKNEEGLRVAEEPALFSTLPYSSRALDSP